MKSHMPVADAICSSGRKVIYRQTHHTEDPEWCWGHEFRDNVLTKCKRVWFGQAPSQDDIFPRSRECANLEDLNRLIRDAVGPQRAPFPMIWLEGIWPDMTNWTQKDTVALAVRAGDEVTAPVLYQGDGKFIESDSKPQRTTTLTLFALMADGSVTRHPVNVTTTLDAEGLVTGCHVFGRNPKKPVYDQIMSNEISWWTLGMALPAMWAIGLMNCRNVKTTEVHRTTVMTKKQRRPRGAGMLSYHTIVLPSHTSGESGGKPDRQGIMAHHMVRGHFATYTAEAPLFGRLTGTFWKPWHVRGNPDNGEVISEYRLDQANLR